MEDGVKISFEDDEPEEAIVDPVTDAAPESAVVIDFKGGSVAPTAAPKALAADLIAPSNPAPVAPELFGPRIKTPPVGNWLMDQAQANMELNNEVGYNPTRAAKVKAVADAIPNLEISAVEKFHDSMLENFLERQIVQDHIGGAFSTARAMVVDRRKAAIIKGHVPVLSASEDILKEMGLEVRPPYINYLQPIGRDIPDYVGGISNAVERNAIKLQISAVQRYMEFLIQASLDATKPMSKVLGEVAFPPESPNKFFPSPDSVFGLPRLAAAAAASGEDDAKKLQQEAASLLKTLMRLQKEKSEIPYSSTANRFNAEIAIITKEGGGFTGEVSEFIKAALADPLAFTAWGSETLSEQAIELGTSAVLSRFGYKSAGMGLSVFSVYNQERFNIDAAKIKVETGHDLRTAEGQAAFIVDPKALAKTQRFLKARADPIALSAMLSMGVASKLFSSNAIKNLGVQIPLGMILDGSGEIIAQFNSEGKISGVEVAAEIFAGIFKTPIEIIIASQQTISNARDVKASDAWLKSGEKITRTISGLDGEGLATAAEILSDRLRTEGVDTVYIDPEKLLVQFNQDGIGANVIETLGLTLEAVETAAREGGDIEIGSEVYIRHILGKDGFSALVEHTKTTEGGFTPAQLNKYRDSDAPEDLDAMAKDSVERMANALGVDPSEFQALQEDAELIRDDIRTQMMTELSHSEQTANLESILATQRIMTRAIRASRASGKTVTPLEFYERSNVKIRGERHEFGTAEQQAFEQAEVAEAKAQMESAVKRRMDGDITQEEFDAEVSKIAPITPYTFIPSPSSVDSMVGALKAGQVGRVGKGGEFIGEQVGLRLDIPAYTNHDTWVPTIHNPQGKPVAHESVAHITDATFTQPGDKAETKAAKVGRGDTAKSPFAQIDGTLQSVDPAELEARANEILNDPEWTQVGYDPRRHSFFYDRETQTPILSADEVIQIGPLVLAKNVKTGDGEAFLYQDGSKQPGNPAFDEWFGDSQVTDTFSFDAVGGGEGGQPKVLYHKTKADFESFIPGGPDGGQSSGPAIFLRDDPSRNVSAHNVRDTDTGAQEIPAYVSMQSPLVMDEFNVDEMRERFGEGRKDFPLFVNEATVARLTEAGFDGIMYDPNKMEKPGAEPVEYVVFDPTNIKSVNNRGTYDPNDARIMYQDGSNMFGNPLDVTPTGGAKGKTILIEDIGRAFDENHQDIHGEQFFPETDENHHLEVIKMAKAELEAQIKRPNSGIGWYEQDVVDALVDTAQLFPTLLTDKSHRDLYLMFAGIFSNGMNPAQAWEASAMAFEQFLQDGVIPTERKPLKGQPQVWAEAFFDKKTNKQVPRRHAGYGVRDQGNRQQLSFLKYLVEREGGVQQAVDWMKAVQSPLDINNAMRDSGAYKGKYPRFTKAEEDNDAHTFGALAFGDKLGRYTIGLHGVDINAGDTTVDLWYTRTFRRWTGRLFEPPLGDQGVAAQPKDDVERDAIFRVTEDLVNEYKLKPGDVQAVLWFFEKRLWHEHGAALDEGTNSKGASNLLRKRGIEESNDGDASGGKNKKADRQGGKLRQERIDFNERNKAIPADPVGMPTSFAEDQMFQDQSGTATSIDPAISELLLNHYSVTRGLKIGKKAKFWRGVNPNSGNGGATYGSGLYVGGAKSFAKEYANDGGRVIEMDRYEDIPQNPLRFSTTMDYENFISRAQEALGLSVREFNAVYPDHRLFFADLDTSIDGIQISTGKDALFVKYDGRFVLEQKSQSGTARGAFTPSYAGLVDADGKPITLLQVFERGDKSSFLHESSHMWLEELKMDAAEFGGDLSKDWGVITSWFGERLDNIRSEALARAKNKGDTEAVAAISTMSDTALKSFVKSGNLRGQGADFYISVSMHEQWARGSEDYFATGKAPSIALADAFAAFAQWMKSIYRTLNRLAGRNLLDVKFSPAVTEVMNRLLATDEEIDLVSAQYEITSLFDTAADFDKTPKEFATHQEKVESGKNEAKALHLSRKIRKEERERLVWWKEERETMRGEVEQEMALEGIHKLRWALGHGGLADGSTLPDGLPVERINRKMLKAVLKVEGGTLSSLKKDGGNAIYTNDSGKEASISPEAAASMFGFDSVSDMVLALKDAPLYEQAVSNEMTARMEQKHGKIEDGAIEDALEAVHDSGGVAKFMLAELEALRTVEKVVDATFLRIYAEERVNNMTVGEATPKSFLSAEKRHAKMAKKALKEGDRSEAYKHQFQRLLNFHMAKVAQRQAAINGKKIVYLKQFKNEKKNWKSVEADYVDAAKTLVAAYDFDPRTSEKSRLRIELSAINAFIVNEKENHDAVIDLPDWLHQKDSLTHYRDLTIAEFNELHDSVHQLIKQGRKKKKLKKGEAWVDRQIVIDEMTAALGSTIAGSTYRSSAEASMPKEGNILDYASLSGVDAALVKVEALLEEIDGKPLGVWHQTIFEPFSDAETAERDLSNIVSRRIQEKIDAIPENIQREWSKRIDVGEIAGNTDRPDEKFTRGNLIMMALNSGNKSNLQKMIRGESERGRVITEESLNEALQQLTEEEWGFVREIWKIAEDMWPTVESIFREENGRVPSRVEPREVETSYGTFSGGYFPMLYDTRFPAGKSISDMSAIDAFKSEVGAASLNRSNQQERVEGFAAPINLSIDKIVPSFSNTIHFITHYEAVRNANSILRDRKLSEAMRKSLGQKHTETIKTWVGVLAAGEQSTLDGMGRFMQGLTSGTTVAILGGSYTTLLAQTLGHTVALDVLMADRTYGVSAPAVIADIAHGMKLTFSKEHREMVMRLSGEMRHRMSSTDRDIRSALKVLEGQDSLAASIGEMSMLAIAGMQVMTVDFPVWTAAFNQAMRAEGDESKSVKYAERVLRKSQSSGSLKDLASVQRAKGTGKLLTMFYTWFSALYSLLRETGKSITIAKPTSLPRAAARVLVMITLGEYLNALMRGQDIPDWDPEEEDEEGKAKWLAKKTLGTMFTAVPAIGNVLSGAVSEYGYSMSPATIFGENFSRLTKEVTKKYVLYGEEGLQALYESREWKDLKPLIMMFSIIKKVPGIQPSRLTEGLDAIFDEDVDDADWTNLITGHKKSKEE